MINGLNPTGPIAGYVEALNSKGLPAAAVAACLIRYDEAAPLLVALLERAADDALADSVKPDQTYHALHIAAGARDRRAFAPLLRLIRQADKFDLVLDRVGAALPRLAIGTFDGDCEALFKAIMDRGANVFFRCGLFDAATYLTWEGRIDRGRMVKFLDDFQVAGRALDHNTLWLCWPRSISLLGLDELEPAARAAWQSGLLPALLDQDTFTQTLAEARSMPQDGGRFGPKNLGHLDDVLGTLQGAYDRGQKEDSDLIEKTEVAASRRSLPSPSTSIINPMRNVGRNNPCPCGSGKKAKRCCLAA